MAYVAVDKDGNERIFDCCPYRYKHYTKWFYDYEDYKSMNLPKGSIKKLIGRTLTWEDEPVELEEV
jgi:hypothetical protein